jgi:hypothetical protein
MSTEEARPVEPAKNGRTIEVRLHQRANKRVTCEARVDVKSGEVRPAETEMTEWFERHGFVPVGGWRLDRDVRGRHIREFKEKR